MAVLGEDDRLIARASLLEGRRQRSLLEGHRRQYRPKDENPIPHGFSGELVTRRSLDFYAAVADQMPAAGTGDELAASRSDGITA